MGILTISFLSCLRIITAKSSAFFMISPHRLSTAEREGVRRGWGNLPSVAVGAVRARDFRGRVDAREAPRARGCWPCNTDRAMAMGNSHSSSISRNSLSMDHSSSTASAASVAAAATALTAPTAFASGAGETTFVSPSVFSRRAPFAARARVARGISLMYRSPTPENRYGSIDVAADVNVRAPLALGNLSFTL